MQRLMEMQSCGRLYSSLALSTRTWTAAVRSHDSATRWVSWAATALLAGQGREPSRAAAYCMTSSLIRFTVAPLKNWLSNIACTISSLLFHLLPTRVWDLGGPKSYKRTGGQLSALGGSPPPLPKRVSLRRSSLFGLLFLIDAINNGGNFGYVNARNRDQPRRS